MRTRIIAALAVALTVLAAGVSPASAGRFSPKAFWGPTTWNGRSAFPIYHDLGVGIFQMTLNWFTIAPRRPRDASNPHDPAYQWPADIDYALKQAARYHMRVLLQLFGTPSWANGGRTYSHPPTHMSDLADFMTAAARRYPNVHLWMIWGEPDRRPNFALTRKVPSSHTRLTAKQARAPRIYAQMLDAGYGALKAVSRSNVVIGGNTYTSGDMPLKLWIEYMRLPNGKRPRMDMYGHNPFTDRAPNLSNPPSPWGYYDFSDLRRLWRLVNRDVARPHHRLKLFLSEWEMPTAPDNEFTVYVTPATQAKWITDAWRVVRSSPFIYSLGWIHLFDDGPGGSMAGLLTAQGVPKPGYYAWKNG